MDDKPKQSPATGSSGRPLPRRSAVGQPIKPADLRPAVDTLKTRETPPPTPFTGAPIRPGPTRPDGAAPAPKPQPADEMK
jgi:hypothetical protein